MHVNIPLLLSFQEFSLESDGDVAVRSPIIDPS